MTITTLARTWARHELDTAPRTGPSPTFPGTLQIARERLADEGMPETFAQELLDEAASLYDVEIASQRRAGGGPRWSGRG
jgi:hypothetical protein